MKKTITLLLFFGLLFSTAKLYSQTYPHFNITAYDSTQSTGYYFLCPYTLMAYPTFPAGTQHHMILDRAGNVVYYRSVSGSFGGDFKLHPNGQMSYCSGAYFFIMDSTFTIVDSIRTKNGIDLDIHDLQILPNGHFLLLGNENVVRDLSSYNMFLGNGTAGSDSAIVTAFVIQELDPAENVVFEWHSIDHFNFDDVDEYWLSDTSLVDWTHVNSVELDNDGNLLVSSRHFNEITKINRQDSSIMWRLGGKRNQFTFQNDSLMFRAQHDARRIANGNITLFDNGRFDFSPLHYASTKEYALDEVNHIATLVWSHNEGTDHYSRSQGNAQRLPNGNTLTGYGNLLPTPIAFNVVDSLQNKVFEILFPDSQVTYRAFNYATIPWQFNRPQLSCVTMGSQFYLSAPSGQAQYIWNTGETTQMIEVTSAGNYYVFVPFNDSAFISSEVFNVTNPSDPCGTVGIDEAYNNNSFSIFPNPAKEHLTITSVKPNETPIELLDILGNKLQIIEPNRTGKNEIDISRLSPGVYVVRIGSKQEKFVKQY